MLKDLILERMSMLGYDKDMLVSKTDFDAGLINSIVSGKIDVSDLDDFDLEVLAHALLCDRHYFDDEDIRKNDVVFCSKNRGMDTPKSNLAKANIQSFMRDLCMIKEAMSTR